MITKNDFENFLKKINYNFNSYQPSSLQEIKEIEDNINIRFPISYKIFVSTYGHGMFKGFEIQGLSSEYSAVTLTEDWKEYGLPSGYIVIEESGGDWIHCLDTSNVINGECPVVSWEQGEEEGKLEAENFYQFLLKHAKIFYEELQ